MTTPVGTFSPNPWKIYDTAGNAYEWVQDDYQDNYINAPTDGTPVLLNKAAQKSLRGGSWKDTSSNMSSSSRDYTSPNRHNPSIGFRLVMPPNAKTPIPGR